MEKQLEYLKNKVLDISAKNPLISFLESKLGNVRIFNDSDVIYDILVKEKRAISVVVNRHTLENEKYRYNGIITDKEPSLLTKAMNHMRERTKMANDEFGFHPLFISIGSITWFDELSKKEVTSPLLLVPVKIGRISASEFTIKYTLGEIELNPTLVYRLRMNGIDIFEYDLFLHNTFTISNYLQRLNKNEELVTRKLVANNCCYLALYNSSGLYVYQDLNDNEKAIEQSKLYNFLYNEKVEDANQEVFSFDDSASVVNIFDADTTQQEAINASRSNNSFVLVGPPGTGKSQTICNIIAKALEDNKKVLMVGEKKVALEVIKAKLSTVGLEDYILELHSHKTPRKDVLDELISTIEKENPQEVKFDLSRLYSIRKQLFDYDRILHDKIQPIGESLYSLFGLLLKYHDVPLLEYNFGTIHKFSIVEFNELIQNISEYYNVRGRLNVIVENELFQSIKEEWALQPSFREIYNLRLERYKNFLSEVDYHGLPTTDLSIRDIEDLIKIFKRIQNKEHINLLFQISNVSKAYLDFENIKNSIRKLETFGLNTEGYILEASDVKEIIENRKLFKGKEYGVIASRVKGTISLDTIKKNPSILDEVSVILLHLKNLGVEDVKSYTYKEILDDIEISSFFIRLDENKYENWFKILNTFNSTTYSSYQKFLDENMKKISSGMEFYFDIFQNKEFILKTKISELTIYFDSLRDDFDDLTAYLSYLDKQKRFRIAGYSDLISELDKYQSGQEDILRKKFYLQWFDYLSFSNEQIRDLAKTDYNFLIKEYIALDKEAVSVIKDYEKYKINTRIPTSVKDSLVDFKGEKLKTKGYRTVRQLFLEYINEISNAKPCFLMSPLSVSTFLPAISEYFDLVIFDEASQIETQYAIGALFRAKNVIICGDPEQLPPTNFFKKIYEDEEEDDDPNLFDYESLLTVGLSKLPARNLKWHYRSIPDDLIYYSNTALYHDLLSFPCANNRRGITVHYLHNGVYENGTNEKEASLTVNLIMEHFENYPKLSLGVVALSLKQKELIEKELIKALKKKPDFNSFLNSDDDEHFFIKNLESVQGDERDVMILSIGYANDPKGHFSHNLGPITKRDGYKRLNVAITRAKSEFHIVTSINSSNFKVNETNPGILFLKGYLEFASNGSVSYENKIAKITEKNIEYDIFEYIESKEYDCVLNYHPFIQIAVKGDKGYQYGIQTDGLDSHGFVSIRDRIRLNRDILTAKNWRLLTISASDWYFNRKAMEKRIDEFLSSLPKKAINNKLLNSMVSHIKKEEEKGDYPTYKVFSRQICERGEEETAIDYLKRFVLELIKFEAPIHEDLFIKRVADMYFESEITTLEVERLLSWVNEWHNNKLLDYDKPFIINKGQKYTLRVPKDEKARPLKYIYPLELKEAFKLYSLIEKGNPESLLVSFMYLYQLNPKLKSEIQNIIK
ncbi:MAG: DUF4011 domain-containing protein [Acholeplasmatales bacterium]|jgi:superfamily I DNA and/or RNA helicase/DNA replication protein DnaC|nr:DUF4011 domain-containing protein [Acholeplasmatales bacterium]